MLESACCIIWRSFSCCSSLRRCEAAKNSSRVARRADAELIFAWNTRQTEIQLGERDKQQKWSGERAEDRGGGHERKRGIQAPNGHRGRRTALKGSTKKNGIRLYLSLLHAFFACPPSSLLPTSSTLPFFPPFPHHQHLEGDGMDGKRGKEDCATLWIVRCAPLIALSPFVPSHTFPLGSRRIIE